jgi:hypothetical protein
MVIRDGKKRNVKSDLHSATGCCNLILCILNVTFSSYAMSSRIPCRYCIPCYIKLWIVTPQEFAWGGGWRLRNYTKGKH